jgi:hypothetical protein
VTENACACIVGDLAAPLRPWVAATMDHVIRIGPEIISGFELR